MRIPAILRRLMPLDVLGLFGTACLTGSVVIACHNFTAADASAIAATERAACDALLPLADLPAGIEAAACAGSEVLLRGALMRAVTDAGSGAPAVAPPPGAKPKPAVVYRRRSGRVAGVVPAHVRSVVQAAIDEGGE